MMYDTVSVSCLESKLIALHSEFTLQIFLVFSIWPPLWMQKTHAYHQMKDDVPDETKQRRLQEIISVFRETVQEINQQQIGKVQLVLVEGVRWIF